MAVLKIFKPAFWDHRDVTSGEETGGLNFRKKWILLVVFTSFMALLPLFIMSMVELSLTRHIVENEIKNSMKNSLHSAALAISLAGDPEKATLEYAGSFNMGTGSNIVIMDSQGKPLSGQAGALVDSEIQANFPDAFSGTSGVFEISDSTAETVLVAYAKIQDSEFVMIMTQPKDGLTSLWLKPRLKLIGYLGISIIVILISIMGTATLLVNRIHSSDRKRTQALHHAEHANKIAAIGRLASGVAHEINNPLAIISQKTGLMIDLLQIQEESSNNERLIPLANDTLDAVTRCGNITKRLLDFARHMEPSIEEVDMEEVVSQMLAFMNKEAERKNISLSINNISNIDQFYCDKGSLQQIFLNLFENAFAAMESGGVLEITIASIGRKLLEVTVSDTGRGIATEDLTKIFEPFYSSKNEHWGTGLGLSITYGLVKELGGDIKVKSTLGRGARFSLTFPMYRSAEDAVAGNASVQTPASNPKGITVYE